MRGTLWKGLSHGDRGNNRSQQGLGWRKGGLGRAQSRLKAGQPSLMCNTLRVDARHGEGGVKIHGIYNSQCDA